MNPPGTYRESNGAVVSGKEALDAWSGAAIAVLRDTARRYNDTITYASLGKQVQECTGIRTRRLLMHWIGKVLGQVANTCHSANEVWLTSLCVHTDGTVGAGYAGAVADADGTSPPDSELHAAGQRLLCYRKYADDLPADGGTPSLTRQEAARRRAAQPAPAPKTCPVHHTTLPRTGQCDECR